MIQPDSLVLFQGDSITDAGRDRDDVTPNSPGALGQGYAYFAGAMLLADYPGGSMRVFNRGVSGDRITSMVDRWQDDTLALKPDVVSILIGVNDTWHGTAKGVPEGTPGGGTTVETYEAVYRRLIADTRAVLPDVRFVLCEPFITRAGAVLDLVFQPEIDRRRAVTRQIAADTDSCFVAFQDAYDQACEKAPPAYWACDGVHPTAAGHLMMARYWIKTVCA